VNFDRILEKLLKISLLFYFSHTTSVAFVQSLHSSWMHLKPALAFLNDTSSALALLNDTSSALVLLNDTSSESRALNRSFEKDRNVRVTVKIKVVYRSESLQQNYKHIIVAYRTKDFKSKYSQVDTQFSGEMGGGF